MAIIDYKNNISRDTHIYGDNVYYTSGQGCGTIWFKNVADARKFIAKHGRITGQESGRCKLCQNAYSFNSDEYNKYFPFACNSWEKKKKAQAGIQ